MAGLYGLVSSNKKNPLPNPTSMRLALCYARIAVEETFEKDCLAIGCVHLGTGGQRALYQSDQVTVVFFGYLTRPVMPPGSDGTNPSAAACFIHDGYLSRGEAILQEISGSFALAIWDGRTETLLLATDRFGLRPIYYAEHAGVFRFASEVKGLLSDPSYPRRLHHAALAEFMHIHFIMGEKTLFEGIYLLPPASILRYQNGRAVLHRYWEIPFPASYSHHPDSYYDDLIYDSLQAAVRRMVRRGIRYGLSLSGGLDSRWIAALLAAIEPESTAITLYTPDSDDTPPAEAVARITGLKHSLWEIFPTFVADLGEMYAYVTDGMDNLWHMEEFPLTMRIGDCVDISVGGFLGDGLFGYEINPLSALLRKRNAAQYRRWRIRKYYPSPSVMTQVFRDNLGEELAQLASASLTAAYAESPGTRGFQAVQFYDLRQAERRYANLAQLAKLSFVDIYHPIADEDVVLAALQLPPSQLIFERAYRRAMATHLPDMAKIPWTFTLTPPTISITGILLKKAAQATLGKRLRHTALGQHPLFRERRYYANHVEWSRTVLQTFIQTSLFSSEMEALGLFHMTGLKAMIQDHFDGRKNFINLLGSLLALSMWARLFYLPSLPIRPAGLERSAWQREPAS